jgi:hypothetical protein
VDAPTRWLVQAPSSLYLGWVSVATIANVFSLLVWLGWDGGGLSPITWAVIMIGVSAVLPLAMSFRQRDAIFTGVVVCALVGIWVKQATLPAVVTASAVAVAVSLAGLLASWGIMRFPIRFTVLRNTREGGCPGTSTGFPPARE